MEYDVLIKQTQEILENNRNDWEDRFISYLSDTAKNRQRILDRRKQFHKWANLSVYFTLGRAKDNSGQFDLRYEGQSVGSVSVSKKGVKLVIDKDQYKNNTNEKIFIGFPKEIQPGSYNWATDAEARSFRKYFKSNPGKQLHPEHKYENLLLKEFSKNSSTAKSFVRIQPVTLGKDLLFQMPTPLSASKKEIKYSKGHGGIDILATRGGHLVIFELKDEYKGPEKVMSQAIAYATFITELCKTKAANDFWNICGIHASNKKKTLYVSILMPDPGTSEVPFQGEEIKVPGSDFVFKLHYMFYDKETVTITRSSL